MTAGLKSGPQNSVNQRPTTDLFSSIDMVVLPYQTACSVSPQPERSPGRRTSTQKCEITELQNRSDEVEVDTRQRPKEQTAEAATFRAHDTDVPRTRPIPHRDGPVPITWRTSDQRDAMDLSPNAFAEVRVLADLWI